MLWTTEKLHEASLTSLAGPVRTAAAAAEKLVDVGLAAAAVRTAAAAAAEQLADDGLVDVGLAAATSETFAAADTAAVLTTAASADEAAVAVVQGAAGQTVAADSTAETFGSAAPQIYGVAADKRRHEAAVDLAQVANSERWPAAHVQ